MENIDEFKTATQIWLSQWQLHSDSDLPWRI